MTIPADSPAEYIEKVPADRKKIMAALRDTINKNLPKGFEETISYGMIGWVVPHSKYPDGYHCDPKLPLPFMSLGSQKAHMAVYHSGCYADEKLLKWFVDEYDKLGMKVKLNMGKSCIRFKKPAHVPVELIGKLASKVTVDRWIEIYEKAVKK